LKTLVAPALLTFALAANAADKYPSFEALAQAEKRGVDYRITTLDRKASVAVLAIHAGGIEPGSGELARVIAADDWSLYLFESLKPEHDSTLHITATRFDEPDAVALVERSAVCVSVHGASGNADGICLGGANAKLRRAVYESLDRAGLGVAPKNIGNRCREQGVQVELTKALRGRMRSDAALEAKVGAAIRDGVRAYARKKEAP
jgi:phage replication-related protein YjqB (UPF0714/DUF867 family)